MPIKSNCWLGTKLDLLKLITHLRCCNTCRTKSAWVLACTADDARMSQLSRYTWSLIPWSHRCWTTGRSNLVNFQGEVTKPNGRQVNWYTHPFTMNLRYFHTDLAMGTWRYASCMSMDTVHSFSLMEARTEAWVGWLVGLDLFNDTRLSGHISRLTQVNVSQSCFHSLNNYSSPIILSRSAG